MESLIFSLNATVPIFMMMVLGILFKKIGWIDDIFASKMNKFVFLIPLPLLLFKDLATVDFVEVWDIRFVGFCFIATLLSIMIAFAISCFLQERNLRGEFIQASYRSSAALLGIALIQNIYGTSTMTPLMIIGSVPLYNVMAVAVLSFFGCQERGLNQSKIKKTLFGIITNPIIIGIIAGLLWSLLELPMPVVLDKTVSSMSAMATPMGLIAMGATFDITKAVAKMKITFVASFMKLFGFCILFLPIAICLGFHHEQLIAILVMLGSATTVSCFVMAKNMGYEGVLSSSVIMMTTLMSGFSLTLWLSILRSFHFI